MSSPQQPIVNHTHATANDLLKQARALIAEYIEAVKKINTEEQAIIDAALAKEREDHINAIKQHIQSLTN